MKMKLLIMLICAAISASAGTAAINNSNNASSQQINSSSAVADNAASVENQADKSAVSVTSNTKAAKEVQNSCSQITSNQSNTQTKAENTSVKNVTSVLPKANNTASCTANKNNCTNNQCSIYSKYNFCFGSNCNSNCLTNSLNCKQNNSTCITNNCTTTSKPICNPPTTSKPNTTTPSKPTNNSSSNVTSAPAAPVSSDFASFQAEVVRLVNVERKSRGLKELSVNATVAKSATAKSLDMAKNNYFDHTSPTYGSPFDMLKSFGVSYRAAGENIAMGQRTPQEVMNGWMNSPGHKANILNSSYTQIGVGIAKNAKGQLIWTQQFIG